MLPDTDKPALDKMLDWIAGRSDAVRVGPDVTLVPAIGHSATGRLYLHDTNVGPSDDIELERTDAPSYGYRITARWRAGR